MFIAGALTLFNIHNLFFKPTYWEKRVDILTISLGLVFTLFLTNIVGLKEYDVALWQGSDLVLMHKYFAGEHTPTILALSITACAGLLLLVESDALPPLALVFSLSAVYMGCVLGTMCGIHLAAGIGGTSTLFAFLLFLFPLNYLLCAIRRIRGAIRGQLQKIEAGGYTYGPLLGTCKKLLSHAAGWLLLPFLCMLPLLGVLLLVMVLFGQKPDAAIRAFTETSDWTFSKMTSPPIITDDPHYLCTVSLKGDRRLVRPTRLGIRHGHVILVNRQLCVANAFEDYIMEKLPRFHRALRHFYDAYGYPLSRHITTRRRANITYILMKPLEWLFLLFLYFFDKQPENRIAMQYTGQLYRKT